MNAKLVGEPTGAKPRGYQDMGTFTLPNSELDVTYSKRLYRFKDIEQDALHPDVHIKFSMSDYLNRRDPQLSWVLKDVEDRKRNP